MTEELATVMGAPGQASPAEQESPQPAQDRQAAAPWLLGAPEETAAVCWDVGRQWRGTLSPRPLRTLAWLWLPLLPGSLHVGSGGASVPYTLVTSRPL